MSQGGQTHPPCPPSSWDFWNIRKFETSRPSPPSILCSFDKSWMTVCRYSLKNHPKMGNSGFWGKIKYFLTPSDSPPGPNFFAYKSWEITMTPLPLLGNVFKLNRFFGRLPLTELNCALLGVE